MQFVPWTLAAGDGGDGGERVCAALRANTAKRVWRVRRVRVRVAHSRRLCAVRPLQKGGICISDSISQSRTGHSEHSQTPPDTGLWSGKPCQLCGIVHVGGRGRGGGLGRPIVRVAAYGDKRGVVDAPLEGGEEGADGPACGGQPCRRSGGERWPPALGVTEVAGSLLGRREAGEGGAGTRAREAEGRS